MKSLALGTTLAAILTSSAFADVEARFIESAPKDRFVFDNTGACALTDITIVLDLSQSAAGLIFDTTATGAGVEVFQPFELVRGADLVPSAPVVVDGQSSVTLTVPTFPKGAQIAFTVDVDDTLPASALGQIRVSGSEIKGAVLRVGSAEGRFDNTGATVVATPACPA